MNKKLSWRFFGALTAAVLVRVASASAQTVVVATGNPDIDVPAVQAAVDQGGEVILQGRFSFDRSPTVPTATNWVGGLATVLVSKRVAISGTEDDDGAMTTIEGGTTPFYVEAPGAGVTIQRLRFVRPKGDAIFVYAVSGLLIRFCKIEGVDLGLGFGAGIDIQTGNSIPAPAIPGKPENVSGRLLIVNNDIEVGGTAQLSTVGVLIFSVGAPAAEVEVHVSGNRIRNTSEPAINVRRAIGRVFVERNIIKTGSVFGTPNNIQAIRAANTGSFLIAHNKIECEWGHPDAQGIGVFSQVAEWPMEGAIVTDNEVTMSPPEGVLFSNRSGGITISGFAQGNVVMANKIRGRGRAALSVTVFFAGGITADNTLARNHVDDFDASQADVFIGPGVTDTLVFEQKGTIEDQGMNTVIVPFKSRE